MRPQVRQGICLAMIRQDRVLRQIQSIKRTQKRANAPAWSLSSNMTSTLQNMQYELSRYNAQLEEACDSISIIEVADSINRGAVKWED